MIIDECRRGSAADDAAWKVGLNSRAHHNERASIHPRGFRRRARPTATPVVPPASRWHPLGEAVRVPHGITPYAGCLGQYVKQGRELRIASADLMRGGAVPIGLCQESASADRRALRAPRRS